MRNERQGEQLIIQQQREREALERQQRMEQRNRNREAANNAQPRQPRQMEEWDMDEIQNQAAGLIRNIRRVNNRMYPDQRLENTPFRQLQQQRDPEEYEWDYRHQRLQADVVEEVNEGEDEDDWG